MAEKKVNYQFSGLEVLDVTMSKKPQDFSGNAFQFDITSEVKINEQIKSLIFFFNIKLREGNKDFILASIGIAAVFQILNFEEAIVKTGDNLYTLPPNLERHLAPIAISTIRGILYMQFRGTYLHRAILPIVVMAPTEEAPKTAV